jgi:IPTL-CTERM motif
VKYLRRRIDRKITNTAPQVFCAPHDIKGMILSSKFFREHEMFPARIPFLPMSTVFCACRRSRALRRHPNTISLNRILMKLRIFAAALCVATSLTTAQAARVVVNGDENTLLSNSVGASFTAYVSNLKTFLDSPAKPGCKFLAIGTLYSGSAFASAMAAAPACTLDISNAAASFTLANLQTYDAVFVSGLIPGATTGAQVAAVLTPYIASGGNVYLGAGAGTVGGFVAAFGNFGAAAEAAYWNPTLAPLGMKLEDTYTGQRGTVTISGTHPLLVGVTQLSFDVPSNVALTNAAAGSSLIASQSAGEGGTIGLIGLFDNGAAPPAQIVNTSVPTLSEMMLAALAMLVAGVAVMRGRSGVRRQ